MKTVNIQNVCDEFISGTEEIKNYITKCKQVFAEDMAYLEYSYEQAAIMLYRIFERFNLRVMISCLNHDHSHAEEHYSIKLGSHINDDVCEFLVTKGGFFDFKGRGGLTRVYSDTIGKNHNISKVIKKHDYEDAIEQLCAIRNYAAHNSAQSKKAAMKAFGVTRISSAGKCLKQKHRLDNIITSLVTLANEVKTTPMS